VVQTDSKQTIYHTVEPVYNNESKILILGTMLSPKSRAAGFYYAHPQNRFWPILCELLSETLPETIDGKKALLLKHKIALWDVLFSCEIKNADDATIKNPVANDLRLILNNAPVKAVFTTGKKATALYLKHCLHKMTSLPPCGLPSTSPANCRYFSRDDLLNAYRVLLDFLN
jgi:hypoxanthine-DNA glycosylase